MQPLPPYWHSHFFVLSVFPILEPALLDLLANQETTHCCLRDPGCQRKDIWMVIGLPEARRGGDWAESKKKQLWQHQRLRLEKGDELKGEVVDSA